MAPRLLAPLAALLLALGAAACGSDDQAGGGDGPAADTATTTTGTTEGSATEEPAPPTEATTALTGGSTRIELSSGLTSVLERVGVDLSATGAAQGAGGALTFPIEGGDVDLDAPSGEVAHDGALQVKAAGRSFTAERPVLDLADGALTAEVDGRRVPLFSVDLAQPDTPPTSDRVVLSGDLGIPGESVLADRLGVPIPDGIDAGDVTVSAERG